MSDEKAVKVAEKDVSQERQKAMLAAHFKKLSRAKEEGRKVAYTFVPGNLTELLGVFDMLPVYPEINALQSGMRQKSGGYIREAERLGQDHTETMGVRGVDLLHAGIAKALGVLEFLTFDSRQGALAKAAGFKVKFQ